MSFASSAAPFKPFPVTAEWREIMQTAGAVALMSVQSAGLAAVLWLIVAAPGLLG